MRNFAVLALAATVLSCLQPTVQAQTVGGSQAEPVVYTLELTDQMISDLRNGQSLRSEIPVSLRNRVTEIRLRFAPGDRNAAALNTSSNQRSGVENSVLNSSPFDSSGSNAANFPTGQGTTNRVDSNGFPIQPSATPQPQNSQGTMGVPSSTMPSNLVPRFIPQPSATPPTSSGFGGQSNNMPATPDFNSTSNRSMAISRNAVPLGPPNPYAMNANPTNPGGYGVPNSQTMQLGPPPVTANTGQAGNPTGVQQPASTMLPPTTGPYAPRQSDNLQIRPSPPTGTEFDTAQNTAAGYSAPPAWHAHTQPQATPQQNNFQTTQVPAQPPMQANPWNQPPGFAGTPQQTQVPAQYPSQHPRQAYLPGQDLPIVASQIPPSTVTRPDYSPYPVPYQNSGLQAQIPGADPSSNQKYVAAHDGTHGLDGRSPVSQLNQFNSFLYFLLLCSIGLNIYLGWILRGFYVRYRELADELRDTFSTAM